MNEEEIKNIIIVKKYTVDLESKIENLGLIDDFLAIKIKNNKKYICKLVKNDRKRKEKKKSIIIHSKIDHVNIVKLYDFYEDDEYFFIFLDYIEGKTLEKIIENISYEENEIFIIVEQIVNVLIFLYDSKYILKDLELRNIFIRKKYNESEKTQILLCNLENRALLSNSLSNSNKTSIEESYNKIVLKLGLIICQLLDAQLFSYLRKNKFETETDEEFDELKKEIEKKILAKNGITENIKNLIIYMVMIGKEQRIHIKDIKKKKWFKYFYKINEEKENKKMLNNSIKVDNKNVILNKYIKIENKESIVNERAPIGISKSLNQEIKKTRKPNIVEETIITDEGYLELYKKEKELLLGLIDNYDREELIKDINLSKKYLETVKINNNSNYFQSDSTEINRDKSEKLLSQIDRKRK